MNEKEKQSIRKKLKEYIIKYYLPLNKNCNTICNSCFWDYKDTSGSDCLLLNIYNWGMTDQKNDCDHKDLELCSACAFRFKCKYYKQILYKNDKNDKF